MSHRFVSVVGVALLVAAAASFVLYRLMEKPAPAPPARTPVVVAARDLEVGTLLRDTDLRIDPRSGPVPAGAVASPEGLIGRGVVSAIYRDEVVLENRLAAKGAGGGLAATIPDGMRAVAVRVNEVVGVAGFVLPGMRVDVLISGAPPGAAGSMTRTLLQNIAVLSAGQNFQKDAEGKPVAAQVVNLLVTPEQAELLSLAANLASIQLVLRNPLDGKRVDTPGAVAQRLFGQPAAEAPRAPAPRRPAPPPAVKPGPAPPPVVVMEIIHGARRAEARFAPPPEERP